MAFGAYSVVPWVDIASKIDQPDIVVIVGHHEPEALVGEDHLGRRGLVAVEVQHWRTALLGYSKENITNTIFDMLNYVNLWTANM